MREKDLGPFLYARQMFYLFNYIKALKPFSVRIFYLSTQCLWLSVRHKRPNLPKQFRVKKPFLSPSPIILADTLRPTVKVD